MKELAPRQYEGLQTITTGHWIFAGVFMVAFVGILIWTYTKDSPITRKYYARSIYFILGILVALILMFVFRKYMR